MSEVGRTLRRASVIASLGFGLCGCGERRVNYPEPVYRENTLPDWDPPQEETDAPDLGALPGEWVTEPGGEAPAGEGTEEANSPASVATAAETSAAVPSASETSAAETRAAETRAAEPPTTRTSAVEPENEKKLPERE